MDVVEPGVSQMKTEEEEAAPKRGRGRPRKPPKEADETPFPRRPRGRPRGSKNKNPRVTVVEAPKERRARGRPRKWPQKTVHQEEQQSIYPVSREAEPIEGPSDQTPPPAVFQENF